MEVPKVEVRYENLKIVADVQTGTRALPTLVNASRDVIEVENYISVLDFVFYALINFFGLIFFFPSNSSECSISSLAYGYFDQRDTL